MVFKQHLMHLKKQSIFFSFTTLLILIFSFFVSPEHFGWTHFLHELQLIQFICFFLFHVTLTGVVISGCLLQMAHVKRQSSLRQKLQICMLKRLADQIIQLYFISSGKPPLCLTKVLLKFSNIVI